MKSIKIQIPKGYEIDEENSTFEEIKFKPINDRFEYIDLGLPSGTLWATCNVGAEKPEEYGKLLQYDDAVDKYELPTLDQIRELIRFCDWKYVNYNGINGCLVIGTNGKSIFLPAAGCRLSSSIFGGDSSGYYWSRTLDTSDMRYAFSLYFSSSGIFTNYYYRNYGRSVRPIKNK